MTENEYLQQVLDDQILSDDSDEIKAIQGHREQIETLLRESFADCDPVIRYGGSRAKGTMIRESYDLDIISYFDCEDNGAGESLEDIYNNVAAALEDDYFVERKSSALRLRSNNPDTFKVDFHIDVVPGRFVDEKKGDCYLYISTGEKKRLKTNLEVHLNHIRNSGVRPAIRLMKLWRARNGVQGRNFVLELLIIDLLAKHKDTPLSTQLTTIWQAFRDDIDSLSVRDPANPDGNDLTSLLNQAKSQISIVARTTLDGIAHNGWTSVFGEVSKKATSVNVLSAAAATALNPTRPWAH